MAVRQVLRMGHPLLRQVASPVTEFNTPWLQQLVADMMETMAAVNGAGLAAPQIGESVRLVIFGFDHNPRYPDAGPVPMTVLINPVIEVLEPTLVEGWEGCLSVPGMRGNVPRPDHIRYHSYDQYGNAVGPLEVRGFHARVVQHEVDHLDGVLYPQRIQDMTQFGFIEELFPDQSAP